MLENSSAYKELELDTALRTVGKENVAGRLNGQPQTKGVESF